MAYAPDARLPQEGNIAEAMLNVVAKGYALALDAPQVSAGTVRFSVKNAGGISHNFAIEGNGVDAQTAILTPGATASLTVDLQPGTYTYRCNVHFHYFLGMRVALTVTEFQTPNPNRMDHAARFLSATSHAPE